MAGNVARHMFWGKNGYCIKNFEKNYRKWSKVVDSGRRKIYNGLTILQTGAI